MAGGRVGKSDKRIKLYVERPVNCPNVKDHLGTFNIGRAFPLITSKPLMHSPLPCEYWSVRFNKEWLAGGEGRAEVGNAIDPEVKAQKA